MTTEEIDTIYAIRKIVESVPGKLMLSELPDAVAKIKAQRDALVKLVEKSYIEGKVDWIEYSVFYKGDDAMPDEPVWARSNLKYVLDQIMKGGE